MGIRPKSESVTVYMTKYALTSGIERVDGTTVDGKRIFRGALCTSLGPNDWTNTREEAIARFEEMRTKKIASLERQIEKLRAMKPKFKEGIDQ